MIATSSFFVLALIALYSANSEAAVLDPDTSYGQQGVATFSTGPMLTSDPSYIGRSALQPDGKLIVTGARTTKLYEARHRKEQFVRRLNHDGSPDLAFGRAGEVVFSVRGSDQINQIAFQADGKVVLAVGAYESCARAGFHLCLNDAGVSAVHTSAIVRITVAGALDPTFGKGGVAEAVDFYGGFALGLQADGKLLLLGSTASSGLGPHNWKMTRFTTDGVHDPAFNGGQTITSRCTSFGQSIAVQPDGGIVVAGDAMIGYSDAALNPGICVERRLPDGSPDVSFNPGALWTYLGVNVQQRSLTILPGGKLLAMGRGYYRVDATSYSGVFGVRYDAAGVPDVTYGSGGKWFIATQAEFTYSNFTFARDGGLVVAGVEATSPTTVRTTLLKIDESGNADLAFGPAGFLRGPATTPGTLLQVDFLRDIDDRWLFVNAMLRADKSYDAAIQRVRGERPDSVPVFEFFNTILRHYFITASAAEATAIDVGAAGPGWLHTTVPFRAFQPVAAGLLSGVPQLARSLCRFYGTPGRGPNSHFYTINPAECDNVRKDPGWTYENAPFYSFTTITGATPCAGDLVPVHRFYNDRAAFSDSNHRYVTDAAIFQQMQQQGWKHEGIAFCAAVR